MKKLIFIALPLYVLSLDCLAQRPVVSGISPATTTVNETVTITGSNLPTGTSAHVQFGAAKGTVVEASATQIKATVPAGASYESVTVTNIASGLLAKGVKPFQLSFGGENFNPAAIAAEASFATNTGIYEFCACDFNNDGLVDVVSTHENKMTVSVLRNTSILSTLSFAPPTTVSINGYTRNVVCGDIDGDGRQDLVVSGAGTFGNKVYLLRNLSATGGTISFSAPTEATTITLNNTGAARLTLHDLNADGRLDIIMTNRSSNMVQIFRNASSIGTILFDSQSQDISITGPSSTYGLSVQDLDGDGLPDLAVSPLQGSNVYLLRNTSSGSSISFSSEYSLTTPSGLANVVAADLNGDGKLDLAATNFYEDNVMVWLNNSTSGSLQFSSGTPFSTGTGSAPWGIEAGDVDGNGQTDLLISNVNVRSLVILINGSTTGLQLQAHQLPTRQKGRYIRLIDMNGDAKPDIAYTGIEWNQLEIMRNKHCVVPRLSHSGTVTLCSGQSLLLKATRALGVTYTWTHNGVALATTTPEIIITDAGDYAVTIRSAVDPCNLSSAVVRVVAGSGAGGSIVMEPIPAACVGGNTELKVTAISGASYVWNGPNGFTATTSTPSYTLTNIQVAAAGSYSVVIKSGECQFTPAAQTLSVIQNPQPQVTASATAFCAGSTVNLQAQTGFATYQWKLNGANYTGAGATTANITTSIAGNYTVLVTNSNGCKGESGTVSITQTQQPVAAFNAPATACLQQPLTCSNTSTYSSSLTPVYSWTFGDGKTSNLASPTHTYTNAGTYTVNLTVSYGSQDCGSTTSKTITVVMAPEVRLTANGSTTFCPGDSVLLRLEGDVNSVLWSTGATTPTIYAKASGTVTAEISTSAGCTLTRSIELIHLEQPQITISASSRRINAGETATLTVGGALRYEWVEAEGISDLYSGSVDVMPLKTTTYTVTGWGENGCSAKAEITIEVDNTLRINAPKIFVPAVDGTWSIGNIQSYPDLKMSLVNSMGRSILEAKPYQNSWDGSENGKPLEAGVYYYIFKDSTGKVLKTGSVTLLR